MDKGVAELGCLCGGARGLYGTFVLVHAVIKPPWLATCTLAAWCLTYRCMRLPDVVMRGADGRRSRSEYFVNDDES